MNERSIFEQALDFEDESSREAFLKDACSGDQDLRQQIDSLLSAHARKCRLLDNRVCVHVRLVNSPEIGIDDRQFNGAQPCEPRLA